MSRVSADDLLVLLEVGRSGRFTRTAEVLGVNHTTVARRVAALERALGGRVLVRSPSGWELTSLGAHAVTAAEQIAGAMRALGAEPGQQPAIEDVVRMSAPDVFASFVAAPAAARVRQRHQRVTVEIIAANRRATAQRSVLDVEVVVGKPTVLRADARLLGSYQLAMFGSASYLEERGVPRSLEEAADHGLVYFVSSMLEIDHLDVGRRLLPQMHDAVTSTSVMAYIEATRSGAGLGLIPTFLASRHPDLVRVLSVDIDIEMQYWLVTQAEGMRRPAVAAMVAELVATVQEITDDEGRMK